MELAAEVQVDNQDAAAYQWAKLQEDGPLPPRFRSPPLVCIHADYNPDLDIIMSDDGHSWAWANEIFSISPALEHPPPKSLADEAVSPLDDFTAERSLKKPDPPE